MKLLIDPKIFEQNRDLRIGAILVKNINNSRRVSSVEGLLRGICAQREKEFKNKDIFEHPMIKSWCQAYGRFGINPQKYPPSIAALLKRLKSGKQLTHVNLLVDLYNYFSLKYLLPIGGEDMDWLCGDLKLTFTKGGEPFRPIASIEVEHAKEGEPSYLDDAGITCRYWNYRECERSKFTTKTVNALLLIEDLSKMHMDQFGAILQHIQNGISKYIGGKMETYILNEENTTIDLGIQGRKNMDDSKVPQQEKLHFLQEKAQTNNRSLQDENLKKKPSSSLVSLEKKAKVKNLQLENKSLLKGKIRTLLTKTLQKIYPGTKVDIKIEYPSSERHGDYASNIALHLSKQFGKSAVDIAREIVKNLPKSEFVGKIEIAGPGFINFFLSSKVLQKEIDKILKAKDDYGSSKIGKKRNLILEYSSPNMAKPLGIHHLLSTIIGQSLSNIFKKLDFNCLSINHIGDWGTQFGKLIYAYKKWGNKELVEKSPISELLKLYVKFHNEAEKDSSLEDASRSEFSAFEKGDKENRELWRYFVDESMKEINETYKRLGGIHFDYIQGESFYEDKLEDILQEGKKKNIFVLGEAGAYVIHFDDPNIPTVPVQKKDAATLYITRDFATLKYRLQTWKPIKILYVVDIAQALHFKQLFATAKRLGWYHGEGEHVWFGRMHMKEGKMSTRRGTVVLLNDVIDEALELANCIIERKNPDLKDKKNVARVVGIGAVKYNILSQNRTTDIIFDWNKMLSFEGNSAPYLQYSYARARSILNRAAELTLDKNKPLKQEEKLIKPSLERDQNRDLINEKTNSLIRLFCKFSEAIVLSAQEYKPNILANYLYELAQKFNSFYNLVPVLAAEDKVRQQRLKNVEASAQILKNGLELLGVEVVEEM